MDCLPFAVTHFGTLREETTQFLGRVKRSVLEALVLGNLAYCSMSMFYIQKGIAKQLVARLVFRGSD